MRKSIPLLLILLTSLDCFSQSVVSGAVVENGSSQKLSGAIVSIEGTAVSEITDVEGKFSMDIDLPSAEYVVSVSKDGYKSEFILIEIFKSGDLILDRVELTLTSNEKKRRKKIAKALEKEEKKKNKEIEKVLRKAKREKDKREKELKRLQKRIDKKKSKAHSKFENSSITSPENTDLVSKYAQLLGVSTLEITNLELYNFIEDWIGTPYLLGGETSEGIDCSSFSQRLYTTVFDLYIERTAQKQHDSKLTDKFQGKEYLHEGDLIFFTGVNDKSNVISHVGIYLKNGRFVHATPHKRDTGTRGVKISNLEDLYWKKRFYTAGRRIRN